MPSIRNVGILWAGQSNQQGAALGDNGAGAALLTSANTGDTDPFRLNANGGGSCLPLLYDLGLKRGVRYLIINGAIGGAEIAYFPGRMGAVITNAGTPIATLNTNGSSMSAGTGVICREGDVGFDPFGLLARMRAAKLTYPQITEWVGTWANAESDGGTTLAAFRDSHLSIGDYFFASGCNLYLPGMSSSGGNSAGNMANLSAGLDAAIAIMRAQGKRVVKGGDLYSRFGMSPPLYAERSSPATRVHLTAEGQRVQAEVWDAALSAAGF